MTMRLIGSGVLLSACAAMPADEEPRHSGVSGAGQSATTEAKDTRDDATIEPPDLSNEPAVFIGNDEVAKLPPARPPIRLDGDAVMLNFEQAPLNEVIHTILGDTLGLDYVIENQVPGEITLRTRSPIPRDQLLPILESLLRNNNVLMIRGPNDRFFISASGNIRSTVPSYASAPGAGFSNVIVPLQYISATEMAEILKPVARDDAFVRVDTGRNLLILAGTQLQLQGWLDIVSTFDVDQLAGKSVGIFPLANSTVEELFAELEHILATSPDLGIKGISGMVRIMPVERLNSIMVVSPRAHYIATVQAWIEELDSIEDQASEPILQVYPVRNGNAGQLASLLSTIYGGSGGASGTSGGVAPGMTQATSGGGADGSNQRRDVSSGGGTFDLSLIHI